MAAFHTSCRVSDVLKCSHHLHGLELNHHFLCHIFLRFVVAESSWQQTVVGK
jgi:hypothetical protein